MFAYMYIHFISKLFHTYLFGFINYVLTLKNIFLGVEDQL